MPFMTRIASDLAGFGLTVELVPGWETRGSSSFAPACVVDHWTAGPRGTTGRPSLNVVTNGRAGLDGPLCNVYLARKGTCVVVAAGRANHAGAGGFRGLVGNSAAYGIEAESAGDGDWTPEMLWAYPRLNAALLSGLKRDASWVCGHNEWAPTRKIDIRDIIGTVRANAAAVLADPAHGTATLEDDLSAKAEEQIQFLYDALLKGGPSTPYGIPLMQLFKQLPASTAHEVWYGVSVNRPDADGVQQQVPVLQELADSKTQAIAARAEAAGLQTALAAASRGGSVDIAAITAAVKTAAAEALAEGVKVTIDVPGGK